MHEERDKDTRGISGDKVRIFALAPPWTHPPLVSWFRLDPSLGVHGRAPAENWLGRVGELPRAGRHGSSCGRQHNKGGAPPGASQVVNGTGSGGHLLATVGLFNKVGWGQGGASGQNKGRRPPGSGCSSMVAN
jgi:hypothetical protein